MAAIEDLLKQIGDARLRERIAQEWEQATRHKKFGLVFEQHLPEVVPIYSAKPRRGDLVAKRNGSLSETWRIRRVANGMASLVKPKAAGEKESTADRVILPLDDLLVVKQFGDPIFPTLVPIDGVQNGPADAPWHTLIEADNYHALQLLEYLYAGKVDCIYIDPPYNSGAKDWKYNSNYVDINDAWRHSKWLSFMEKRLHLAKKLLAPSGVLIALIDDNEFANLSVLAREIFSDYNLFTVVIEHNKRGRQGEEFAKTHEYALFAVPDVPNAISEEPIDGIAGGETRNLRRTGNNSLRKERPGQFYPIFVDSASQQVISVGSPLQQDQDRNEIVLEGAIAVWPIDKDGVERNWHYGPQRTLAELNGKKIFARQQNYGMQIYYTLREKDTKRYKTVWSRAALDASTHGTELLTKIFGSTDVFPYPKSIYAVRDCLSAVCANRKNALVVDFFAGSGTTLNALWPAP